MSLTAVVVSLVTGLLGGFALGFQTRAWLLARRTPAALRAAQRELREETGYVSDTWRPLLVIPSSATISDNYAYLFAAENCRKVTGQELDPMELLRVRKHTADEIDAMLAEGRFQQSVHALAWLLSRRPSGEA